MTLLIACCRSCMSVLMMRFAPCKSPASLGLQLAFMATHLTWLQFQSLHKPVTLGLATQKQWVACTLHAELTPGPVHAHTYHASALMAAVVSKQTGTY